MMAADDHDPSGAPPGERLDLWGGGAEASIAADTLPPAIHASHAGAWIAWPDGRTSSVSRGEALALAVDTPCILLNAAVTGQRLTAPDLSGLDLLELFAFVSPASFAVPTPSGLARALGMAVPATEGDAARTYLSAAHRLLSLVDEADWPHREGAWDAAMSLARLRWSWAPYLTRRIARPPRGDRGLWTRLPEWEETPARAQPRTVTIDPVEVATRLDALTGSDAETRPGQRAYAEAVTAAFAPRAAPDHPHLVLAEAGTGIGKTLGYLAPAAAWVRASGGAVCVSTYTKALQRQLARETQRLYPDPAVHKDRVVVRKGRENYLCLLNLEDALQGGFTGRAAVLAQLVGRWAAYTRDGDMVGGDLPGWLPTLFRRNAPAALTDRRGECIYAACPHYRRCFIERSARDAGQAEIIIANHALMMVQAARPRDAGQLPTRLVFDEGHHLFDAADSMFAVALTGQETVEVRRWILGPERGSRGRRRGLAARLSDVAAEDEVGGAAIDAATTAAAVLPSDGWLQRLADDTPFGPIESLLAQVRRLVLARDQSARGADGDAGYGLETPLGPVDDGLIAAARAAIDAIDAIAVPLRTLGQRLDAILEDAPDWLDTQARQRVDGARHALSYRVDTLTAWGRLLERVGGPEDARFVDWLLIDRIEGRLVDAGLRRHWLDPMKPVADIVLKPAHGVLVTSATLRAGGDWSDADRRTGAVHLPDDTRRFAVASPFDYANRAEVLVVTDVLRGDIPALSGAYSALIEAAGGGVLGLFNAIRRLRLVHQRIADRLARSGLPLYAQHVDPLDTGTLVDIFRDDPAASLLGTDALRDGVDVPGASLRLVVMEGVPWPRPTVLHAARRAALGGGAHDDRLIRARLAQAFGRLLRRADDRGQFVILSAAMPSRLLTAFPVGTPIRRVSLQDAVRAVEAAHLRT